MELKELKMKEARKSLEEFKSWFHTIQSGNIR